MNSFWRTTYGRQRDMLSEELSRKMHITRTICQAISTDILHFPARVLVIQGGKGYSRVATLIPETVLSIASCDVRFPVRSASPLSTHGPARSPCSERRSGLHGYAAAIDAQVWHDADRLASTRVRRAAAARDVKSAGTASPVPK